MKPDLGLLFLRVTFGLLMLGHGWGKLMDLIGGRTDFADPLGIGPVPSLILATFAEFLCSLAVIAGFKVRWTAIPVVITMAVAFLIVHADDPFARKEKALLFACGFLTLVFTGGGRYALDAMLKRR